MELIKVRGWMKVCILGLVSSVGFFNLFAGSPKDFFVREKSSGPSSTLVQNGPGYLTRSQFEIKTSTTCEVIVNKLVAKLTGSDFPKSLLEYDYGFGCIDGGAVQHIFVQILFEAITHDETTQAAVAQYLANHHGKEVMGTVLTFEEFVGLQVSRSLLFVHYSIPDMNPIWTHIEKAKEVTFRSYADYLNALRVQYAVMAAPTEDPLKNLIFEWVNPAVYPWVMENVFPKVNYVETSNDPLFLRVDGTPMEGLWKEGYFRRCDQVSSSPMCGANEAFSVK